MRIGRGAVSVSIVIALAAPAVASEVTLELQGGRKVQGRVLAVGPKRLVVDASGGLQFLDRADVRQAIDEQGRTVSLASVAEPRDVAAIVVQRETIAARDALDATVRLRRDGRTLDLFALRGSEALLRVGDEIRTGPYGRVTVIVPGGAKVAARANAILRFDESGPSLEEGVARLEHQTGEVSIATPNGRVRAPRSIVEIEHLRGRTLIGCYGGGDCELEAREGFRVELPRNCVADVACSDGERPAYVAASPSNAWPLRIEARRSNGGVRRFSIPPGQRAVLLMDLAPAAPAPREAPRPAEPTTEAFRPRAEAFKPRDEAFKPRDVEAATAGRVTRATAPFQLRRAGTTRTIAPDELPGLRRGDELATDPGDLEVAIGDLTSRLERRTSLLVDGEEGHPGARLLSGGVRVETSNRAALGLKDGELALAAGRASVGATRVPGADGATRYDVALERGQAGLTLARDLVAELAQGDALSVTVEGSQVRTVVRAQGGAEPPVLSLLGGGVEVRTAPGRVLDVARRGGFLSLTLANGAILELDESLRARVSDDGAHDPEVTWLVSGEKTGLPAGSQRRFRAENGRPVAMDESDPALRGLVPRLDGSPDLARPLAPTPRRDEPVLPEPAPRPEPVPVPPAPVSPAPLAPRAAAAPTSVTLPNGAVLTLKGWGALATRASSDPSLIEVEGPDGSTLLFGANVHATLSRTRASSRIDTEDGRSVVHELNGPRFSLRLGADKRLSLDIQNERSIVAEPGVELAVQLRSDGFAVSFVFGQTYYLKPGRPVIVDCAQGLKLGPYVAKKLGRE